MKKGRRGKGSAASWSARPRARSFSYLNRTEREMEGGGKTFKKREKKKGYPFARKRSITTSYRLSTAGEGGKSPRKGKKGEKKREEESKLYIYLLLLTYLYAKSFSTRSSEKGEGGKGESKELTLSPFRRA